VSLKSDQVKTILEPTLQSILSIICQIFDQKNINNEIIGNHYDFLSEFFEKMVRLGSGVEAIAQLVSSFSLTDDSSLHMKLYLKVTLAIADYLKLSVDMSRSSAGSELSIITEDKVDDILNISELFVR
jgi:hypothetical protein